MMHRNVILSINFTIFFLASACGVLAAIAEPTTTPAPTATATLTPTITPLPTITPTATPSIPIITLIEDANCYGGPSETAYALLTTLKLGEKVEVIGQDSEGKYWIIDNPHGEGGCWIQSQKASEFTGDMNSILLLVAPPTSIPPVPDAPANINTTSLCKEVKIYKWRRSAQWGYYYARRFDHFEVTITITWNDVVNEMGYKIFRNGDLVADLDADTTEYADSFYSYEEKESFWYEIHSVGEAADSPKISFSAGHSCVKSDK